MVTYPNAITKDSKSTYCTHSSRIIALDDYTWNKSRKEQGSIDCLGNDLLFRAVVAMREDTANNQYWVFDEDFDTYRKGDFVLGRFHRCSCYCHVATLAELKERFKNE